MKVAGDRVGRFAPCPKCGQTLAIAEHRVEPSAEHSLMTPERLPRYEPALASGMPVIAVSMATAAILIFLVLFALAPPAAAAIVRIVGSPVLTNILLFVVAVLLWNSRRR
jgi:hypothetical protein